MTVDRLDPRQSSAEFADFRQRPVEEAPSNLETAVSMFDPLYNAAGTVAAKNSVAEATRNIAALRTMSEGQVPGLSEKNAKKFEAFVNELGGVESALSEGRISDNAAKILMDRTMRRAINKNPFFADHYKKIAYEMTGVAIGSEMEKRIFDNDPKKSGGKDRMESLVDEYISLGGGSVAGLSVKQFRELGVAGAEETLLRVQNLNTANKMFDQALTRQGKEREVTLNHAADLILTETSTMNQQFRANVQAEMTQVIKETGKGGLTNYLMKNREDINKRIDTSFEAMNATLNGAIARAAGNEYAVGRLKERQALLQQEHDRIKETLGDEALMKKLSTTLKTEHAVLAYQFLTQDTEGLATPMLAAMGVSGVTGEPIPPSVFDKFMAQTGLEQFMNDPARQAQVRLNIGNDQSIEAAVANDAMRDDMLLATNASVIGDLLGTPKSDQWHQANADIVGKAYTALSSLPDEAIASNPSYQKMMLDAANIPAGELDKMHPKAKIAYSNMLEKLMAKIDRQRTDEVADYVGGDKPQLGITTGKDGSISVEINTANIPKGRGDVAYNSRLRKLEDIKRRYENENTILVPLVNNARKVASINSNLKAFIPSEQVPKNLEQPTQGAQVEQLSSQVQSPMGQQLSKAGMNKAAAMFGLSDPAMLTKEMLEIYRSRSDEQ